MITAQHLIDDIRSIMSSGGNSDDNKVPDELILFWVNEVRSMLISQAIARRDTISDAWIQNLNCFEMELVDISDCCTVPTGCYGLRSVRELPGTVETDSNNLILGVYSIDGEPINELNKARARYTKYNKYTSKDAGWFIKNNRLYIVVDTLLEMVTVSGIFEDPSDLATYTTCDDAACWSYDSPYPISLKMAGMVTDIVIKTKAQTLMNFPMDNSNNASSATPQQAQQSRQE